MTVQYSAATIVSPRTEYNSSSIWGFGDMQQMYVFGRSVFFFSSFFVVESSTVWCNHCYPAHNATVVFCGFGDMQQMCMCLVDRFCFFLCIIVSYHQYAALASRQWPRGIFKCVIVQHISPVASRHFQVYNSPAIPDFLVFLALYEPSFLALCCTGGTFFGGLASLAKRGERGMRVRFFCTLLAVRWDN